MKNEIDYIEKIDPNAARRALSGHVERRMVDGDIMPEIYGIACVFEQPTDMGWYIEKVARGAFDSCDMSDVVALFNHEEEELLSRTTGNPDDLQLIINNEGLAYQFRAKNECSKEVAENIGFGFIKGSSFAFSCGEDMWDYEVKQADGSVKDIRTITKFSKLYDVSPVTWPAYQQTSVALRSKEMNKPKPIQKTLSEIRNSIRLKK